MKSRAPGQRRGTRAHGSSATQASHSFFVEGFVDGRILESPRRSRDLNVHGRQSKPRFHFNANMAIYIRISEKSYRVAK